MESKNKWIKCSDELPEIDPLDDWNYHFKVSKSVLTYSKEWGVRYGQYHRPAEPGFWALQNVHSFNGIQVDFWMDLELPE